MKKNLILSLFMLLGVTACQKENKSTTGVAANPKLNSNFIHDSLSPAYTDLTLHSDGSYTCIWNNCAIKVTGTLGYDQVKYPTLMNGVPVTGMNFTTWDGISSIDYANTGTGGAVFQVTQDVASLNTFQFSGFYNDLGSFWDAYLSALGQDHATLPVIDQFVKDSYTITNTGGQSSVHIYTGKLIRVTTGSHLALATLSYPLPTAQPVSATELSLYFNDPDHPLDYYRVYFSSDIITKATHNNVTLKASGTATLASSAAGNYHLIGTVIKSDGTPFKFDHLQDPN